jgi:hypothetical protein
MENDYNKNHKIDQIKVYDNFFSEEIQEEIVESLNRPKWSFTGGREGVSRFWHMDGLERENYFSEFLFNIICDKLDKKFKIVRIYANGQTAGQSGIPHKDDGEWTLLYYPNKEWLTGMEGNLLFLEEPEKDINPYMQLNLEVIKTISYKSNRAVLFPAKILHYAAAPERHYNGVRKSLAYKMFI